MNTLRYASAAIRKAFMERRLLFTLLLMNLAVGLLLVLPFWGAVHARFDSSLLGRHTGLMTPELAAELGKVFEKLGPATGGGMVALAAGAIFLAVFTAGGILGRLSAVDVFSLPAFLSDCARYLWRNVRLALYMLLAAVPFAVALGGARAAIEKAQRAGNFLAPYDTPRRVWLAALVVVFVVWRAVFDAGKAVMFAEDERRARVGLWRGAKLVLGRPWVLAGYALVVASGLVVVGALMFVHAKLPQNGGLGILAAFLFAQLVLWVRLGFQTAALGLTLEAHRARRPGYASSPAAAAPAEAAQKAA